MGAVGLIGTVASTGLQLYGQHQQAKAVKSAASYNNNLAEAEAHNTELETAEAIKRTRINNRASLAEARASLSDSGTLTTSGSPLNLLGEAAGRMETGIADAARASAMETERLRQKGRMGLWEAKQQAKAIKLNMLGTGIAGLTKAASQFQEGSYQGLYRIGGKAS